MPTLENYKISFGCDPEFFFTKKGEVIGAEKVLPETGFEYIHGSVNKQDGDDTAISTGRPSKIVIDGVQAELNPRPNTCRANLGNEISCCMKALHENLLKKSDGLSLDFRQTITLSKKELKTLSDKSKIFGCAPSTNTYKDKSKINIKRSKGYTSRSAGGHIHIGDNNDPEVRSVLNKPEVLVPLLDIIVGNTCVLIDRDPGNKKRRRLYGRAGEYRAPAHGIEYRTLSNFWMRDYALMSFVMGLTRQAVIVAANSTSDHDYATQLRAIVPEKDIKRAINKNDFNLALKNFNKIERGFTSLFPTGYDCPITGDKMSLFKHFVKRGLDYWFKEDPLEHWVNLPEGHGCGWERFLSTVVAEDLTTKDHD